MTNSIHVPIVEARGLVATVPSADAERRLLHDLDLEVAERESVAILGRSGSGKSTLLSILGLMQRPQGGTLRIAGRDVSKISESEAATMRRDLVGFVFQSYSLVANLSVFENVALPLRYGRQPPSRLIATRVGEALAAVGLSDRASTRPARLSGGEQQRVAIARALIRSPKVILADEPTGALDTETGWEVITLLRTASQAARSCLVVVTHDPEIASQLDRQLVLSAGRLAGGSHVQGIL